MKAVALYMHEFGKGDVAVPYTKNRFTNLMK